MPELKPELSGKNRYWISKHRYYELKHFCLQYPEWKKMLSELEIKMETVKLGTMHGSEPSDPTARLAESRVDLQRAIALVEQAATDASSELKHYLLLAVTEGIPFATLQAIHQIPCGKDMYYDAYRKFFWLLSQRKGI